MVPKWHILIGFVVSLALFWLKFLPLNALLIVFIASFMIDVDHYIFYALQKRDINPIRAVKWFYKLRGLAIGNSRSKNMKLKKPLFFLHWWFVLALLFLVGFFYSFFLYVAFGFVIHLILDLIEILYLGNIGFYKFFFINTLKTNKNKKSYL